MFRYNHMSRCAECTRFTAIKEGLEENMDERSMFHPPLPCTIYCSDCWYNEDVR